MPKVIVERPRRGGGWLRKGRALRDDDLTLSESEVRSRDRKRGYHTKELNENLAPLKRFLEKQVGRPWNKVWSEVSANLKPSNAVQQHVRDHVPDFVAIKTSLKDGEVWVHGRGRFGAPTPLKTSYVKLYVHPKSGLVLRNKHFAGWKNLYREARAEREEVKNERRRIVSEDKQLHLLNDGGWWEVTLAAIPLVVKERESRHGVHRVTTEKVVQDVVLRAGLSTLSREDLYGRPLVFAKAKRQLSKKEMRDLDLR
jgi:hypothetical protein